MATQPSPALSGYQRAARSLAARSALPLAAGAAALASAPSAHAQAVSFHPTTGNIANFSQGLYIDFDAIMGSVLSPSSSPATDVVILSWQSGPGDNIYSSVGGFHDARFLTVPGAGYTLVNKLGDSVNIDSTSIGSSGGGNFNPYESETFPTLWSNVTGGFIGLKFYSSTTHGYHYGWLQVNTNSDASEITLIGFGYNQTPGAAIMTGQAADGAPIPEPATSAALLALGAAGLVAYRRRKHLQRAAA